MVLEERKESYIKTSRELDVADATETLLNALWPKPQFLGAERLAIAQGLGEDILNITEKYDVPQTVLIEFAERIKKLV